MSYSLDTCPYKKEIYDTSNGNYWGLDPEDHCQALEDLGELMNISYWAGVMLRVLDKADNEFTNKQELNRVAWLELGQRRQYVTRIRKAVDSRVDELCSDNIKTAKGS
ncbi:unnamed protein product [Periconia digitata]|uniref:Uncharacterized protein n=1 Tax=Periconia digitata TaxID=1303443 RepID=A0A9W4UMR8_9PLEO|nr:unnamed protein product [Periconia digitata]